MARVTSSKVPLRSRMGETGGMPPGGFQWGCEWPGKGHGQEAEAWGHRGEEMSHRGTWGSGQATPLKGVIALTVTEREAFFSYCPLSRQAGAPIRRGGQAPLWLSQQRHLSVPQEPRCAPLTRLAFLWLLRQSAEPPGLSHKDPVRITWVIFLKLFAGPPQCVPGC